MNAPFLREQHPRRHQNCANQIILGHIVFKFEQARTEMGVETLDAVADRGYYTSEEILACEESGITGTLPKPLTSGAKAKGRFGKQDFVYVATDDV